MKIPQAPRELSLEHTTDEHTKVLAQVDALRKRGQHELAAVLERAYRSSARLNATKPPRKDRRA